MTTTRETAKTIRRLAGGKIFGCTFTKRTTGELRTMQCRLGVSKGVTGAGMAYDPEEKGLLPVYDMAHAGYRMIPLDAIQSITVSGETYHLGA